MKKIALILPYFGEFPNYFKFWVQSVKNNPSVDWLLFTDCDLDSIGILPENLKVFKFSFQQFRELFRDYFPFEIELDVPYKLCDFRVVYGQVLKDYVVNYDFWGYCDCDLIWGDIRKFVTEDMLDKHDHLFGLGPFQLQRVIDESYLEVVKQCRALGIYDYKHVFSSDGKRIFNIDELPFGLPATYYKLHKNRYYNEFSETGRPYDAPNPDYYHFMDSFNSIRELGAGYKKTMYFNYRHVIDFWNRPLPEDTGKMKYQLYEYNNGRLNRVFIKDQKICTEELMYVHFRLRKFKICTDNLNQFFMVPDKLIAHNAQPSLYFMWRHGHQRYINYKKYGLKNIRGRILQNMERFKAKAMPV